MKCSNHLFTAVGHICSAAHNSVHGARVHSPPTLFPVENELAADGILETCPVGFVANRVDDGIDHAVQKSQEIPRQDKGTGAS